MCLGKAKELEMRAKVSDHASEPSQKEFKDYKDKVARILQVWSYIFLTRNKLSKILKDKITSFRCVFLSFNVNKKSWTVKLESVIWPN